MSMAYVTHYNFIYLLLNLLNLIGNRQVIFDCPAGTFGAVGRLSDATCSGKCVKGYFCPIGSTSNTQVTSENKHLSYK